MAHKQNLILCYTARAAILIILMACFAGARKFDQVETIDEAFITARRKTLQNGLALTPQMGWNTYNHFPCKLNDELIRQTADAMVSTGLSALGYEYINLDDCWADLNRDSKVT